MDITLFFKPLSNHQCCRFFSLKMSYSWQFLFCFCSSSNPQVISFKKPHMKIINEVKRWISHSLLIIQEFSWYLCKSTLYKRGGPLNIIYSPFNAYMMVRRLGNFSDPCKGWVFIIYWLKLINFLRNFDELLNFYHYAYSLYLAE